MAEEKPDTQFHIKEFYQLQGEVKGLRESMVLQFKSLHELIVANFDSINKATEKALASNDKKLETMNEFRGSLKDYVVELLPRKEFDSKHEEFKEDNLRSHDQIKDELAKINIWKAEIQTELKEKVSSEQIQRLQKNYRLTTVIAIIGILVAIALAWFKQSPIQTNPIIIQPKTEQTK
jgi:F0F1-type ATP synthase assembly protein I